MTWVFAALKAHNGEAALLDVANYIWTNYEADLRTDKKRLLTWQYDMRWGATQLRKLGVMNTNSTSEPWSLTPKGMEMEKL